MASQTRRNDPSTRMPPDDLVSFDGAPPEWIDLAADIRAVDGNHDLGAGALASALTARGWTRRHADPDTCAHECPFTREGHKAHDVDHEFESR